MESINYKKLAREMQRGSVLVSKSTIALMFDLEPNGAAIRQITAQPDFPRSQKITENGHDRYIRRDVENWALAHWELILKMQPMCA